MLVDGYKDNYLATETELSNLNREHNVKQLWTPQNSGIQVRSDAANALKSLIGSSKDDYIEVDQMSYYAAIDELDAKYTALRRTEQSYLRFKLFGNNKYADCCICGERYPVEFLVTAHIKKRSLCDEAEKRDFGNIVASMCKFGCDDLYEKGYISVVDGLVVSNGGEVYSDSLNNYVNKITNKECVAFNADSKKYFDFQRLESNPRQS